MSENQYDEIISHLSEKAKIIFERETSSYKENGQDIYVFSVQIADNILDKSIAKEIESYARLYNIKHIEEPIN